MSALPHIAAALALAATVALAGEAPYSARLVELVNAHRTEHSLSALTVDRTLATLAQEHSAAMAKAQKMSHEDFASRVRRSGLAMCVENVGWNYPTAQAQFEAWRQSSGHNRNMLDRRVQRIGIAEAEGYTTMIACHV